MRPRISSSWRSASSWVIFSLATRPPSCAWVTSRALVRPWSTNSCLTSLRTTGMPAEATTWAISPPMVPAPTTAALKTNIGRRLLMETARSRPSRLLAASVPLMSRRTVLERGLHVAVLWALAVAGPLFDTLGGNPEFFAVRAASPGEIVAFALLVAFVPPLALLAAEWLVGLVSEAAAWALHVVFVAALSGAVVLGVLSLGTGPALALALAAGTAAAIVYVRFPPARTLLTVLGPAPLAFVALFLLVSDAS